MFTFTFSTEFDNQAGLKKALDEGAVDAIVVYYCGPEFSQEKYTAVRSIRFPQHTFGVGAFWNVDGEKWPIYDNEYDGDLFKCLKNATRGERWIPRPKETPCHQTFKGAQRKGVIHKDSWMYVVIGSAALLVFILGVGAIYSWQFQKTTANLRGKPPGGSGVRNATNRLPVSQRVCTPGSYPLADLDPHLKMSSVKCSSLEKSLRPPTNFYNESTDVTLQFLRRFAGVERRMH